MQSIFLSYSFLSGTLELKLDYIKRCFDGSLVRYVPQEGWVAAIIDEDAITYYPSHWWGMHGEQLAASPTDEVVARSRHLSHLKTNPRVRHHYWTGERIEEPGAPIPWCGSGKWIDKGGTRNMLVTAEMFPAEPSGRDRAPSSPATSANEPELA